MRVVPLERTGGHEIETDNREPETGSSGVLYVVSTPLGNLEDITLRALKVLKTVDLIAAEGVEHTRALCRHYGIKIRVTGYNQHNQKGKGKELLRKLQRGAHIALVTNAGTPGVSDPGVLLARQVLEAGIRVSPIPGPSAVTAALSVSGFPGERFLFVGFLASRSARRKREIEGLSSEERTMVFFEAPHRVVDMLGDLLTVLGDRPMVLVREMTKLHEQVIGGTVRTVLEDLGQGNTRGEFTLVVAGRGGNEEPCPLSEDIRKRMERLVTEKATSVRDAAKKLALEEGLPWRRVYRECLSVKREKEIPRA